MRAIWRPNRNTERIWKTIICHLLILKISNHEPMIMVVVYSKKGYLLAVRRPTDSERINRLSSGMIT